MDIDSRKAVSQLLNEIGFNEIATFVERDDDDKFLDTCVKLILHKTPRNCLPRTRGILYVSGLITSFEGEAA